MVVYISRKISWLRCFVSFLPAAGVAALLCLFLAGPRLGHLYDFLVQWRAPPLSGEILLVDSSMPGRELGSDILEPGAAASLLYTMSELGARALIIQVPVLGFPAGGSAGEEEILYRFDEEFSLLSNNIRNLFDAIRTGSVAPADAARYVGELVDLSEKGKQRLVSALLRRDEEGIERMERAAAFFGNARRPGDIRVQLIMAGEGGSPGVLAGRDDYSRPQPDRDGVLRRIAPVLAVPSISEEGTGERTLEHIIYRALKDRLEPDGLAAIPLDRDGAVLFEPPRSGDDFRRIGIADFLAYDEADRELRRLLAEGEALGIFQDVDGENRPPFLYDYALLLRNARGDSKQVWIASRARYFESLQEFLYGAAEINLVNGYEEIMSTLDTEAGIARITEMRNSVIWTFAALKMKHSELLELRERLETALSDSFCILGNPADTKASALLANTILSGRAIKPGEDRYLFFAALFFALLTCLFVKSQGPAFTLGAGLLLSLFAALVFCAVFIIEGWWFDPQVPAAASCAGVIVSFIWALVAKARYTRHFRLAYAPFVSQSCFKSLLKAGEPLPSQRRTVKTAVIAIHTPALQSGENSPDSIGTTQAVLLFQEKVSKYIKKAGGISIANGAESSLVTVCFGSPLERIFLRDKKTAPLYNAASYNPVLQAVDFVSETIRSSECAAWNFGIDMGQCTFAWTAGTGYFALGVPVQRARILSRLTTRYQSRIIISDAVNEALPDLPVKKLASMRETGGTKSETFYRFVNDEFR